MSTALCRLCLSDENVVDIFHTDLENSDDLRNYILLATGINIHRDDVITNHVCTSCCTTAIKVYKFRVTSLANDRALKLACKQTCDTVSANIEDMVAMNTSIIKKLLDKVEPPKQRVDYAVHPSVVRMFKRHQSLIIPTELLTINLDPKIYLKPLEQDPLEAFKATRPEINVKIVRDSESRKRPAETEHSQFKRTKVMNDVVVNPTKNLDVEPKPAPSSANVSYKIVESSPAKGNANKIVLARVFPSELDTNVSDSRDSVNSEDQILNSSPPAKRLRPRRSRPSFFLSDYEYDSDEDLLLDTIGEEVTYNCQLCNKSFELQSRLKKHMRYHKNCLACNIVFRSSDALLYHQTNVCFKRIIANQPTLCLPKCDDSTEIASIKSQNSNIELNLEKEADELLYISDDEESTGMGLSLQEENDIRSIFDKHKNKLHDKVAQPAVTQKDQHTATDLLINSTINANGTQIKIEGMFATLKSIRVPVKLQIREIFGANLEANPTESTVPKIETWTGNPKQLKSKPLILNGQQPLRVQSLRLQPMSHNRPLVLSPSQSQQAKHQSSNNVTQAVPYQSPRTVEFMENLGLNYVYSPQMVAKQQSNTEMPLRTIVTRRTYSARRRKPQVVQVQALPQKTTDRKPQKSSSNEKQGSLVNGYVRVKAPWQLM